MRTGEWTKEERDDHLASIRDRLRYNHYCSICNGWLTPKEKRVPTATIHHKEKCICPKGTHNGWEPDVDDEDVEWLLDEIDALKTGL